MNEVKKLLKYLRPYKRLAFFALAMLIAMVVLDLSIPRLVQQLIDRGVKARNMQVVLTTSAIMLAISFLSMAVAIVNNNTSIRVGESVARDLREAIFAKIQGFSEENMDRFSTGKLMVRLTSDAQAVQRLVQVSLRIGTRAPLTMAGSIALMFVTCPSLAWSMLPVLLITMAIIVAFSLRMEPLFRGVQGRLDRLNSVLQENIAGARLVKAFVRGDRERSRFEGSNSELTDGTIKVMEFMSSMTPALTALINVGMVLVVWIGGGQAIGGKLSIGQIIAFSNYLVATMNPLIMMTQLSNTWANGLASAKRVNEILEQVPTIEEAASPVILSGQEAGRVGFSEVGFKYGDENGIDVLDGISLEARSGQTIAILGATGSGKSSLVSLIPRFYDPTEGTLFVGGVDARKISFDSLLEKIAIVPQDTILFSGTIRDNIRFGRPGATEDEIIAAAQAAQAHDFILAFPAGYDTKVEERGVNLSGGQKQRIAIARAIACKPSIMILDDSTSAVDVETETKIQRAIAKTLEGCTCFIVAQRISTVLNADKIIVLDAGRIVAAGKHSELFASSPVYREIFDSQLGGGIHG